MRTLGLIASSEPPCSCMPLCEASYRCPLMAVSPPPRDDPDLLPGRAEHPGNCVPRGPADLPSPADCLAAVTGLLGHAPVSSTMVGDPRELPRVEYTWFVRYQRSADLRIYLNSAAARDG